MDQVAWGKNGIRAAWSAVSRAVSRESPCSAAAGHSLWLSRFRSSLTFYPKLSTPYSSVIRVPTAPLSFPDKLKRSRLIISVHWSASAPGFVNRQTYGAGIRQFPFQTSKMHNKVQLNILCTYVLTKITKSKRGKLWLAIIHSITADFSNASYFPI